MSAITARGVSAGALAMLSFGAVGAHAHVATPAASTAAVRPLVTYRLGNNIHASITLTVAPSGKSSIIDRSKPKTYRFVLKASEMKRLKTRLADASIATLDSTYTYSGPPITCGIEKQRLTAAGRTITVMTGATTPAGLERVLKQLRGIVDRHDPLPSHTAQRCIGGSRS